jgi:hypothetical protein
MARIGMMFLFTSSPSTENRGGVIQLRFDTPIQPFPVKGKDSEQNPCSFT